MSDQEKKALQLQEEIYQDLEQVLNAKETQEEMLITLNNLQQDFVNYFDSGDLEYLKDGNLLLSTLKNILIKIALRK